MLISFSSLLFAFYLACKSLMTVSRGARRLSICALVTGANCRECVVLKVLCPLIVRNSLKKRAYQEILIVHRSK